MSDVTFPKMRMTAKEFANKIGMNVTAATSVLSFLRQAKAIVEIGQKKTSEKGRMSTIYQFGDVLSINLKEFVAFDKKETTPGDAATKKTFSVGDVILADGTIEKAEGTGETGETGETAPAGDARETAPAGDAGETAPAGETGETAPAAEAPKRKGKNAA